MPVLSCAATTCIYNKDELCSKGEIKVAGDDARHPDDTCCASFVERSDSMSNSAGGGCGCTTIDICCEACKCTFNDHEKCTAREIGIEGSNACSCEETECGSFRCENC